VEIAQRGQANDERRSVGVGDAESVPSSRSRDPGREFGLVRVQLDLFHDLERSSSGGNFERCVPVGAAGGRGGWSQTFESPC